MIDEQAALIPRDTSTAVQHSSEDEDNGTTAAAALLLLLLLYFSSGRDFLCDIHKQ